METPIRQVRVPEELWQQAKRAAAVQGTTTSALINRFLRDYVRAVLAKQQISRPKKRVYKRTGVMFLDAKVPFVKMPAENALLREQPIDPKRCKHIRVLDATFGTWCEDCGVLLEIDKSSTEFLQRLAGELQPPEESENNAANSGLSNSDETTAG